MKDLWLVQYCYANFPLERHIFYVNVAGNEDDLFGI